MELHLITSNLQLGHAQARSCIWSRANISSMITSQHGAAFDHMQKSPGWSQANMGLNLITSKHLHLDHAQTWSYLWLHAKISNSISMYFCDSGISGDSNAIPCWLAASQPAPTLSRFLMPYFIHKRVVGNVYYNTCTQSMKCRPGDRRRTVVWLILSVI